MVLRAKKESMSLLFALYNRRAKTNDMPPQIIRCTRSKCSPSDKSFRSGLQSFRKMSLERLLALTKLQSVSLRANFTKSFENGSK